MNITAVDFCVRVSCKNLLVVVREHALAMIVSRWGIPNDRRRMFKLRWWQVPSGLHVFVIDSVMSLVALMDLGRNGMCSNFYTIAVKLLAKRQS